MCWLGKLVISGDSLALRGVPQAIDASLSGGWKRDSACEARYLSAHPKSNAFCYRRLDLATQIDATLIMVECEGSQWEVRGVTSTDSPLTREEYNAVLADFYEYVVQAAAQRTGVIAQLLLAPPSVEENLSSHAYLQLRLFSASADKSSLVTQLSSQDVERWRAFVSAAFREGAMLEPGILARWLQEHGWPQRPAAELAARFTEDFSLLRHHTGQ